MAQSYEAWKKAPESITYDTPEGSVAYKKADMTRELSVEDTTKLAKHLREIHRILVDNDVDANARITIWTRSRKASLDADSWVAPAIKMLKISF